MSRLVVWNALGLSIITMCAALPCGAQGANSGTDYVGPGTTAPIMSLTLAAARAGVAPSVSQPPSLQRAETFSADSDATTQHRGTHAVVGAVIGATMGMVVGTALDYAVNRKTLNDPNAEPITVHVWGFLLPPVGAITGAIIGWHY